MNRVEVDGAHGEGRGQILRSALALAMCTGQPTRISSIRSKRSKPGLMRQHLTALKAAAEICHAEVEGAEVGSGEISFHPGPVEPGDYSFDIGTAGSCTLVLQTLLPALLQASGPSQLRITGGTHNKGAPSVDFLQRAYLPLLERMGAKVSLRLQRYGFYPRGGGELVAIIEPVSTWRLIEIGTRGAQTDAYAEAYIAAIPLHVAERELDTVGRILNWPGEKLHVRGLRNDMGPGNVLTLTLVHEQVTEVFTGFGELGVSAETVAKSVCRDVQAFLAQPVAVGSHLADQLLLPFALASGGVYSTCRPSLHFESNAYVIERFLPVKIGVQSDGEGNHRISVVPTR